MNLYTILLLNLLLLFVQKAVAEDYNNIAVRGTVENPSGRNIRVILYSYVPGENHMASGAELDEANGFHFVSTIREPVFGRIYYGKESIPLYLEPGFDLNITFDARHIRETLRFSGTGAFNNSFLLSRLLNYGYDNNSLQEEIKKMDTPAYQKWAMVRRKEQQEMLNSRKADLSQEFVLFQEADIDYSWANELFSYARFKEENQRKSSLSDDFFHFMDEVKLHYYEVIHLQSYRDFLENYVQYNYGLMKESLPKENTRYYNNLYKVSKNSLRSLPMYHMQAVYLVKAINYLGVDYVTDEYIEFANECPVQAYKNVLHQMVKSQTVSPKEPEVILTDKRGHSFPLKELNGKIVLVRFTNYLNDSANQLLRKHDSTLREKLQNYKDVRFLELPMEHNQGAFEKMIYADATEYLKSIMNRPKPGQEKPKVPPFSYILLNREGLVVSNSLDDPHNELAIEKIDALLQQEKRSAAVE